MNFLEAYDEAKSGFRIKGGMTMVMVTHEMSFAAKISSQVVFMEAGTVIETGTPAQIFQTPRTERLKRFLKPWFDRSLVPADPKEFAL